jgi:FSR family fosmidomycin resistance protein-like MFS transporter
LELSDERADHFSAPAFATGSRDRSFGVILAISACHLLNDMMQSLLPAIYPNLKARARA